jgi:hypothetical protein
MSENVYRGGMCYIVKRTSGMIVAIKSKPTPNPVRYKAKKFVHNVRHVIVLADLVPGPEMENVLFVLLL